jgi:GT2 family glycosyltransferase
VTGARRITAIVPCFDRPDDLALLLGDLATIERTGIDLRVLIVDNGSRTRLCAPTEHPLDIRILRLTINTGGSGGYNAGMSHALIGDDHDPEFLWLIDSDARVERSTLRVLLEAMDSHEDLGVVGPVLCDADGQVHEIGGRIDRKTGEMGPARTTLPDTLQRCDYVAACCLLVRASAVRTAGVFPPIFLNGDDSTWCMRLAHVTGKFVAVEPNARARHPRFDGFPTFARGYTSRNAFEPLGALTKSNGVYARRALIEAGRAINLAMTDRMDLARLHLQGLRDAARDRVSGPMRLSDFEPFGPLPPEADGAPRIEPTGTPKQAIMPLVRRIMLGPAHKVAVVPAKGHPSTWLAARTTILEHHGKAVTRKPSRIAVPLRAALIGCRTLVHAARIAIRPPTIYPLPPIKLAHAVAPRERTTPLKLSVIVLSYNRKDALLTTLQRLTSGETTRDAELVVVDNASGDGSAQAVREQYPGVRVLQMEQNKLIEGFNIGVRAATGDLVLILDDDARPDQASLREAIDALENSPDLGAATLMPVHPKTGLSEWPFVRRMTAPSDNWPVMGCCNLVRRDLWLALGGYDSAYRLYRNDVELALRILSTGMGVRFDPRWVCEHDSPAAANKSERWCRQATRNWLWLCRRHGRGGNALLSIALGWAMAHRHAGVRLAAQKAVMQGVIEGLRTMPDAPGWFRRDDRHLARLLRMRLGQSEFNRSDLPS